jgi:hypothetical protein
MEVPGMPLQGLPGLSRVGPENLDPDPGQGLQELTLTLTLTGSGSGSGQGQPDPELTLTGMGEVSAWHCPCALTVL